MLLSCCFLPFSTATTAAGSPTEVTVTCQRPNAGWPTTGFGVTLTAVDRAGCPASANATNATAFTVQQKPTVAINGDATATTCAYAPNATLTYTVTSSIGGEVAVGVTTNTTAVSCTLRSNAGECVCSCSYSSWHGFAKPYNLQGSQCGLPMLFADSSWHAAHTM